MLSQRTMPGSCLTGYIGGAERDVEVRLDSCGVLLRVEGGSDFWIGFDGHEITRPGRDDAPLEGLDYEIMFGPALVLARALQATWCLHASAACRNGQTVAFLGESGHGKSTLAAYLGNNGWQRVADDILPVTGGGEGVMVWPHFPQLKLPPDEQPALYLPENLPLDAICLLAPAASDDAPRLEPLSTRETVTVLLSHTAGARLFWPELLSRHLDFCAWAGQRLKAWRLIYPHRREALPIVRQLLEKSC